MEEPKYVYKTNEKVDKPVSDSSVYSGIRIATWIIVGLIIICSLIFQSNLLGEMSWTTRMIFIALVIGGIFCHPKTQPTPSEMELWFYDDYFVVYKSNIYYDAKSSHREYFKFYFSDVSGMNYNCFTKRFNIYGKVDATFYKYNKDGTLPNEPYYHRITDGGICYFYVFDNDEKEIINMMETYVGQKVQILNKQN